MLVGYLVRPWRLRWWIDIAEQRKVKGRWVVRKRCPGCRRVAWVRVADLRHKLLRRRYTALCRQCSRKLRATVVGRARIRQLQGRVWRGKP